MTLCTGTCSNDAATNTRSTSVPKHQFPHFEFSLECFPVFVSDPFGINPNLVTVNTDPHFLLRPFPDPPSHTMKTCGDCRYPTFWSWSFFSSIFYRFFTAFCLWNIWKRMVSEIYWNKTNHSATKKRTKGRKDQLLYGKPDKFRIIITYKKYLLLRRGLGITCTQFLEFGSL